MKRTRGGEYLAHQRTDFLEADCDGMGTDPQATPAKTAPASGPIWQRASMDAATVRMLAGICGYAEPDKWMERYE